MSPSRSNLFSSGATQTNSPPAFATRQRETTTRRTAIAVEGVTKAFNGTPVITGIDLDIRAGELIALLGPSGSGKTTLLRIIAGLEKADAGRIVFGDTDQTRVPVQKREVGFVFQHYALFKHMSVADNIAYGLKARRRRDRPAREVVSKRVGDLLDLIKLSKFANHYPSQLSGGQRQRVALARALAVDPRVLLLDEPFGALDAQVRKDLRRWLREIHERTGQTTIFVTHDQDEALELSDRVAILHEGRLEQVGTPFEVQDDPATVAVLKFLGDAYEAPADVEGGRVSVAGQPVSVDGSSIAGPRARLFVRPWQFEQAAPDTAHVHGIVQTVYRSGGRTHVAVAAGGDAPVSATLDGDLALAIGDPVGLAITGGHLFAAGGR